MTNEERFIELEAVIKELTERCSELESQVEGLELDMASDELESIAILAEAVRAMAQRIAEKEGSALADVFYMPPTRKS
jgi:hypothetical protein